MTGNLERERCIVDFDLARLLGAACRRLRKTGSSVGERGGQHDISEASARRLVNQIAIAFIQT